MENPYQYPVFFECTTLNGEQKKKIENYFHICRKSGGGDCGAVTAVDGKVYSIAFKEREAQQRVLQRSEHVLEFASGSLVLAVRCNQAPHSSPHATPTPGQTLGPDSSSTQQIHASSLTSGGEEYELKLDLFLLRYLKEHPKAERKLEQQLAAVCCSAQLHPEEERVLVRRLALPDAVGDISNWKAQVDKVFDGYLCHYEMDSHKIKALLKTCIGFTDEDEVKVYTDIGMAIVVGARSHVTSMLTDLENLYVKHRRSLLTERQTSVRRLGEGKICLLWEGIEQSLGQKFPELKVTRGDAGQLVLEGSVEDLLKAGEHISDEENLVSERTVSNKSPHFFTFLRKVYGSPGMLGEFLGVGDKVEVELRDTELHFFSLCFDDLDEAERKLEEKFKDVKIYVPNCSVVPPELQEKLKSKEKELNQRECRGKVVFAADNTLCLLGRTEEVEELKETVTQFILDQLNIEGTVILPFPELVQLLPELLQLHLFDFSSVSFHPVPSSTTPMVVLQGPSSKVTEVRNRLGPFLDSLVQEKITIDLPAAVRYFQSHSGRDSLLQVSNSHKSLVQFEEQPHISRNITEVAKYSLQSGIKLLVYKGDITQQYADVLVNAANEDLDHCGGVAAALSKAAGPQMQKESKDIIKQTGKIPVGDVVVTSGGDLKCKKLLHAVGPVGGKVGGREKVLLEKTVLSALNLAEMMEFQSIAMPCISSGVFGVPVTVCAEAIVTAVKEFGSQGGRSLSKIILIDSRQDVVRAMQEACRRLLQGMGGGNGTQSDVGFQMGADGERGAAAATDGVCIEIVQGSIETQKVDALVSPMVGHNPLSTRVGNIFSKAVGPQFTPMFNNEAGGASQPDDTVVVENLPSLQCKAVIFLNQVSWDNDPNGNAVQVLRQGIRKILASCGIRGYSSVAFPVLGTGVVLGFPHSVAARVLMEELESFEQGRTSRSPFLIRIVVHPNDKESSKAFQSAQEALHLKGLTNDSNPAQASFYQKVSLTNDEVTAMLGGVKLQMVHGNIINAGTDVIVNTTDFTNYQSGVSKAIMNAAGPTVLAELAQVGIPSNFMCTTSPGTLGCKEIVHAGFKCDPEIFRKNCKKIVKLCESKGYNSVAFPAINTGAAGMDSVKACKAMLDGMAAALTDLKPNSLTLIRIIIMQQPIFQAFRSELESRFGQQAPRRLSLKEKAKEKLKKLQEKISRAFTPSTPQGQTFMPAKPQPAVFRVISCGPDVTRAIKRDLEDILQKELIERAVDVHQLSLLDDMELEAVRAKISILAISLEHRKHHSSGAGSSSRARGRAKSNARDQSGSGQEVYVLKGLNADVLSVTELIHKAAQTALCKDLLAKEEAMLALTIQWSMKDSNGEWQELSLHDNYRLEEAHIGKQMSVDISTPDGRMLKVNLSTEEATDYLTGITHKVKRSESKTALELPSNWEPMYGEIFKRVELQSNSPEYKNVAKHFLKTAKYNICKIERVQNLYLWHAYSVCLQRILAKNGAAELGEKFLYHGTSAESCHCIERDRFDRGYAGAHAARFGKGVYFAVKANYSARGFSPSDASGLKRMYVARVLTGRYTVGNPAWSAPPPRGSDPTDRFDSLVDDQQPPSMFVIFHDDQAYPEYLITFN
ncbi:protein mono-ADP-ribosyltransferase PARP14-like isoform X2 [Melanotaenia boesemani]|uniref:protein mono-ADP-ribosyltransferase PARP14-like isoform X2 n=1 Tax=Melanotaenia boesemani TaxID=1250792 RepID=UPI001C04CC89|nr:protein mono-ADP-ribosyltransferase PARP14-like isoform X2 [Melanotaenia boesemani]